MSAWGELPAAGETVTGLLRAAADALEADLAVWRVADHAAPSDKARQARRSAIATASAVITSVSRLRAELEASAPAAGDLMTRREVAYLFETTSTTVARWAKSGKLAEIRGEDGRARYRRAEVEALFWACFPKGRP